MKFFRIITADITSRSNLRLPSKFVETHGENMPATVTLRVPTGAEWRVELKKKADGFWLGKGLFEFAQSLGVKYGHFLVFDYYVELDNVFHVVAIDMSAVEIQYPPAPAVTLSSFDYGQYASASKRPKLEQVEDDAAATCLGQKNRSIGAPAPIRKHSRKTAKASKLGHIGSVDGGAETDHTTITKGSFGREIILNSERRIQCVIQGRRWNETSPEEVITRAKAFKAEEPVCIIALRPTYVSKKYSIDVPAKCQLLFPQCFINEYFNLDNKYAALRTNDGKTWPIEYRLVKHQQAFFTYGWRQFVEDNCLNSGDVCLFELIKGAENALKVVIFRSTPNGLP